MSGPPQSLSFPSILEYKTAPAMSILLKTAVFMENTRGAAHIIKAASIF